MYRSILACCVSLIAFAAAPAGRADWQPVEGRMLSRFAQDVTVDTAWREYPRPQMVRSRWRNLNGLWEYALTPQDAPRPAAFDGEILVPFPIESALSGVKQVPGAERRLWYRRKFTVPPEWSEDRVILHFGAVDWRAVVSVNGKTVGEHKGGYTPFHFDITDALAGGGEQELVVSVWDPTDAWTQARGKQVSEPAGIWYTSVTGIWQTVWMEPVPAASIAALSIVPNIDSQSIQLRVSTRGRDAGMQVRAAVYAGGRAIARGSGSPNRPLRITIENPRLWTPDSPHLYDLDVQLTRGQDPVDRVGSYFAMRKVSLGKDDRGFTRLMLNNRPIFMLGPLDQGWWPDGLYTAPTDEALRYDIEVTKKLGFNMARKHVKVEPARWYYHCDRLGLMVWQDMPNGNLRRGRPNKLRVAPGDAEDARAPGRFRAAVRSRVGRVDRCLLVFPFDRQLGSLQTKAGGSTNSGAHCRLAGEARPSRLVNANSGWTDRGVGHVYDTHMYSGSRHGARLAGTRHLARRIRRPRLAGRRHLWWNKRNWGYRTYYSREALNEKYLEVVGNVIGPIGHGLAAAVYTQTTDVEGEVNGLMTYDREIVKFDEAKLRGLHNRLYAAAGRAKVLLKTSEHRPQTWRYPLQGTHRAVGIRSAPRTAAGSRERRRFNPARIPFSRPGRHGRKGRSGCASRSSWRQPPTTCGSRPTHAVDQGVIYLNGKKFSTSREPARRAGIITTWT